MPGDEDARAEEEQRLPAVPPRRADAVLIHWLETAERDSGA